VTSATVAGLALSAAVLVCAPPRRRLAPRTPIRRRVSSMAASCFAAGCIAAAVAVLPVTTSLAAAVLGATLASRHRRRTRRRRATHEARALGTALDILVGDLRVGAHPVRAFDSAAAETDQPAVAAGLRAVAARARLGADVSAGLRAVARSSSLPAQWERLAVYWDLGHRHGLAVSTLMQAAHRDITARQRFTTCVHAGLAGARSSAAILAALPVLGVLLGQLVGAAPVNFLLSGRGGVLLMAGVTLVCAGLLWSDRITERLI
jgi:tight adherence protein B